MATLHQFVETAAPMPALTEKPIIIPLSDTVSFQYFEHEGKRTGEGLIAADRWYPGILNDRRFLFGLHQDDRFIPGIVWCRRFIPGLVTRHGFLPGLALKNRFVPGIIASGAFVPGVCKGRNFVPGILGDNRFMPGLFMTDGRFMPGRFFQGSFENGVWKNEQFVVSDDEKIPAADANALAREGFGLSSLKRFDAIGGFPICGMVSGTIGDTAAFVDHGVFTDEGVILGGLWGKEDPLTTVDNGMLEEMMKEKLGIDTEDMLNAYRGFDKFTEMVEKFGEGTINDLFWAGPAFGGHVSQPMDFAGALDELTAGTDAFINRLNQGYWDWFNAAIDSSAQGMIREGGGDSEETIKETLAVAGTGYAIGSAIAGPVGGIIGAVAAEVGMWLYKHAPSGSGGGGSDKDREVPVRPKKKQGGSVAGEPGEENDEPYAYRQPRGFMPPYLENPHATQWVVTASQNQFWEDFGRQQTGVITIVYTDTGKRVIVNMAELRRMLRMAGTKGLFGGTIVVLGLNPLTGTLMTYVGHPLSAEEREQRERWLSLEERGRQLVTPGEAGHGV